jgi:DegV family protein with EDD domain
VRRGINMTIKIVTDSTSDIPLELAKELSITVVPLYVKIGDKTYRDREDISEDEFYNKLISGHIQPTTSQPTPQDFLDIYKKLSQQGDGIISIHISQKMSGTLNSALQAKQMMSTSVPIEIWNSETVSMGLGLITIKAAQLANSGASMLQITEEIKKTIRDNHVWALFDTLKYLAQGGRIGKAKGFLGTILNIKPLLFVKDGEMAPISQPRTRDRGIDLLYDCVSRITDIQDIAIAYNTTPDEAQVLAKRLGQKYDKNRIRMARIGSTIGVYAGPGALEIAAIGKKTQ